MMKRLIVVSLLGISGCTQGYYAQLYAACQQRPAWDRSECLQALDEYEQRQRIATSQALMGTGSALLLGGFNNGPAVTSYDMGGGVTTYYAN